MRYVEKIQNLWETGSSSFVGENRPSGRATVEKGFWLEQFMSNAGRKTRGPYRWFQRADDEELIQTEIPNILSIDIDREVDSDAATCRIVIQNTVSLLYGEREEAEGVWGKPGYFSFSRGSSQEAKARWGQSSNEWSDVFVPNALIRCVDPLTEIFTKRGWLNCDEVELGDEALGINPETGMSEWQEIVDIFKQRHVGPMVEMKTRGHDSVSTPDHKWLVKQGTGDAKKFEWRCTNTLNTRSFIPLAVTSSDVPTSEIYSDDFVELAAWYFTEGTAEHRQRSMTWGGSICQSRTANPQNVKRIENLMTRLYGPPGPLPRGPFVSQDRIDRILGLRSEGFSCRRIASILGENKESVRRWIAGERSTVKSNRWRMQESEGRAINFKFTAEVVNDIRKVIQGPDKIPSMEFLTSLTQKQLELFIDVCILADGHTPDDESRNQVFIQQAGGRLDAFVSACALAGKAVSITEKPLEGGQVVNCCKVTLLNMDECAPVNALAQSKSEPTIIDYDGIIWCPSVKHGNWLARRNGRLYYTGNTYQGYGGHDKTIDEAVTEEDIVQTGCWLVDSVEMSANGNLTLSCRDMMKLLIDQQLYPPLMPKKLYPLDYYRWVLTNKTIPKDELPTGVDPIGLPCHYGCDIGGSASSSTDAIYGFNTAILGHYPTDAFDSSSEPLGLTEPGSYAHQSTFWLSNGHSSPTGSSSFEWIEVCCDGQDVNKMYIHPFGGDYECYISVWENGGWVAPEDSGQGGIIPYGGVDYTGVNAADIPYVTKVGVKWEAIDRQAEHVLPRVYKADKIRLTFTNLTRTDWEAPNNYRAGVRKTFPMYDRKAAIGGEHTRCFTCAPFPKVDSDAQGYWQVRQNGNVYAFGDARIYTPHASNPKTTHKYWTVASYGNHDGLGYWTMSMDGTVIGYGSAQHYGDASSTGETGFMGFAPTPTGNGYWLLHRDGYVYAYGDAVHEGDSTYSGTLPSGVAATAHAIESHPSLSGYWVLWTDGHVDALGSVTHYGNADRYLFTDTEYVACLRRTSTGSGYWIVSGSGWVKAYGDAPYRNSAEHYAHANWTDALIWDFVPNWNSDNGYALQRANGLLEVFGDFEIFGSVAEGVATQRSDGNYGDYSDIVKELAMWSGFLLYDTESTPLEPGMFGIIETTGVYSKEPLPQEMFDKKPVVDAITELKQVVGYQLWVDQEGGLRFQCVDEETQALSRRGWVNRNELVAGDEIYGLNPGTGLGEWVEIDGIAEYEVEDEELFSMESRGHSSLTTKNHRWWTHLAHNLHGKGRWATSNTLSTESRIPIAAASGDAPTQAVFSNELVELVAWFYTEGSTTYKNAGVISQSEKANPDYVDRIRKCFERLAGKGGFLRGGYLWCEFIPKGRDDMVRWRFKGELAQSILECAPDRVPTLEFLTSLTLEQRELFLNVSIQADGHTWGNAGYSEFVQKDERRVAAFEQACVLTGHAFSTNYDENRGIYRIKILKTRGIKPIGAARNVGAGSAVGYVNYTGSVWCPQMKKHHVWLARRNGTVYYTGNSPNWWSLGNYDYDNEELDLIPVIDERVNLTSYGVSTSDTDLRSEIMISTEDPTVGFTDTVTTRIKPHGANLLRGMVKPGHWINGEFIDKKQQEVMADLISMHIWFGQRRGSANCWANPLLDINDQVRIYERTTGETFVHYVRGISTSFNAMSGEYTMSLTTNWLGGSPFNNRPMFFACVAKPDGTGYWQARNDGQIWSFGTAELYSTDDTHRDWVVAMKTTQSGEGYYTLDITGKIIAYGDAVHYGDLVSNDKNVLDMALTPSGNGYWMLKSTGEVIAFGDATDHGDDTPTGELPSGVDVICHAIESHPSLDGFWILRTDGTVVDFGAVTHYGNADRSGFTGTEYVATLRRTSTGSGYWIVSGSGKVQEFGDATYEGQPTPYSQSFWVDGLVWDFMPDYSGDGYIIQHSDGILDAYSTTYLGDARKHDYKIDTEWAITGGRGNSGGSTAGITAPDDHFEISGTVIDFLGGTGSPSAIKAVDAGFKVTVEPTGP